MKRIFIILVTFFTSITIEAQIFNRVYDNNNLYDGVLTITETPSGYLMGGTTQDIFSGYVATYLIHIDFNGDTLWTKEHNLSASGEIGYSILKSFDGNYVLCGTMHDTATTTAAAYLMKINAQGDSLWMKQYGSTQNDYGYSMTQTLDGGFVIVGQTWNTTNPNYSDAWVFKTDSVGNMLWQKQFDEHGLNDIFEKVIITPDGNIVCAGVTVLNSVTSKDYVVKLNQLGDTVWTKEFGGVECGGTLGINNTADGGFIGCGDICVNGNARARAYKLDSLGNLIWAKDFARSNGPSEIYNFVSIHEMPNGNFMAAGSDYDLTQSQPGDAPRIRMMEFNASGDSIWSKQYPHSTGTDDDYLFDMKPTTDGGYVMCGYVIHNSPTNNDALVIKVDSNGCADTTCQLAVGVEETLNLEQETLNILMYPNPTTGVITFEYDKLEFEELSIDIFSVLGEKVFSNTLNSTTVNLSNLKNGMYLIRVVNNLGNNIYTTRLILQK